MASIFRGIDPLLWPRNAGSYPGYVFTGEPLTLAAGHFGLGHGSGAHAPDEYYVIESANPKIQGFDGAVMSFANISTSWLNRETADDADITDDLTKRFPPNTRIKRKR